MTLRSFSFGGGVQSTAALVLAAQGRIDFRVFLFANVGEDSENPDTLAYVQQVSMPFAEQHGLELTEIRYTRRDGASPSLLHYLRTQERSVPIPMYTAKGPPGRRKCTAEFKIKVIAKHLKQRGVTAAQPSVVGLGISLDEIERARTDSGFPFYTLEYPLIDLRLTRADCIKIISDAGLPVPAKSSCWFCPFHRARDWQDIQRRQPANFTLAVELERMLSERNVAIGRMPVFLSGRGVPLDRAFEGIQPELEEGIGCESGFCWT